MDELAVFDPRGRVDAEHKALVPRVAALKGLRLGILDNTKWNANRLLRKTAALLEAETFAAWREAYGRRICDMPSVKARLVRMRGRGEAPIDVASTGRWREAVARLAALTATPELVLREGPV